MSGAQSGSETVANGNVGHCGREGAQVARPILTKCIDLGLSVDRV
jgi:hypothetical protein